MRLQQLLLTPSPSPRRTGQTVWDHAPEDIKARPGCSALQPGFECLQGWSSHKLSELQAQHLNSLWVKIASLYQVGFFSCSNLCPLPAILLLGTSKRSLTAPFLPSPTRQLQAAIRHCLCLIFSSSSPPLLTVLCSNPNHLGGLLWTHSSMSVSVLYWDPGKLLIYTGESSASDAIPLTITKRAQETSETSKH